MTKSTMPIVVQQSNKYRMQEVHTCHPDAVKLCNARNLVFLIDSTYKTNRYRLSLLDFVGVTPTRMTFFAGFVYLEGERVNNVVWSLERFRDLFLRRDALPRVIVTDRDLTLMNAVKIVFPKCTNLCRFHINKNVKSKCRSLIGKKNAWEYVMDAWRSLVDCRFEHQFDDCLKKFEISCSPWSMFVDYVNKTWIIPHKEKFVKARTNTVMHLRNMTINRVDEFIDFNYYICLLGFVYLECRIEFAHWALKILLQNSLEDLYSLPYTKGYLAWFQVCTLCWQNPSPCGCVMRTTHGLPCACELSKYSLDTIPLETIHMFWRRLSFSDQGLNEPQVTITEEMKIISKRFEELDVCGKRDSSYWEYVDALHSVPNSNFSSSDQAIPRRTMPMLDQFHSFIHDYIENIVDVKADGNCGYRAIVALLGMSEDSWSLVRNHLLKELAKWSDEYINFFGGINRFEELKKSILFDGLSMVCNLCFVSLKFSLNKCHPYTWFMHVTMDKWMDITDMGYVIATRSQPPTDSFVHRVIYIGHVFGNHFVLLCYGLGIVILKQSSGQLHILVECIGCSTSEGACTGASSIDVAATKNLGISSSTYVSSCMTGGCLGGSSGCVGLRNGCEIM
ncbi:hypothetical protein HKD37_19G053451 [Glycine soja]